jgi:DNA repair exonuclease SbcCD ATPase subunit
VGALQIDAIKAASLERQAQLDRETAELKQQQDDLTAKLKEFQQRVSTRAQAKASRT